MTGIPLVYHEFNAAIEQDLFRAEVISLPIAMLILLAVFGTLVGAVAAADHRRAGAAERVRGHLPAGRRDRDEHLRHEPGDA